MLTKEDSSALNSGTTRKTRHGNSHESIVPYQTFVCGDGESLAVACGNDRQWADFVSALDDQRLESPEFSTNASRVSSREKLIPLLESIFSERPIGYYLDLFSTRSFPYEPVRSVPEALSHPQVLENSMLLNISGLKQPAHPASHTGVVDEGNMSPPPELGQDTRVVLEELGYDEDTIQGMYNDGVVK